jgi:hypothetical protein
METKRHPARKFLIGLITFLVVAFVTFLLPTFDSADAQVGWGRSSVRSWFFSQAANTSNNVFVAGYLPAATANTEADIWGGSGEINWPAAAGVITVVSTSANDDGAPVGTGARTIVITGLDGDYEVATETVTLNGTTGVDTTATFLRVNLVTVATVGALEENAGAITGGIAGDEVFRIVAGRNATNRAVYTIPNDCAGYIVSYYATATAQETRTSVSVWSDPNTTTTDTISIGAIEVYLARRNNAGLKTERGPIILAGGDSHMHNFELPLKVEEQVDIYLHTYSRGVTIASGGFGLWQICDVPGWL